jgi:hypothetical protein
VLRQLARLTRPLADVPGALAIAVYADEKGDAIAARERGYEGVACVDDAGRALVLLCDIEAATQLPVLRTWAAGLLEFLFHMQDPGGRFFNFITHWNGTRNESGPTSFAGGGFWHARGVHALARACRTFDDPRVRAGAEAGMSHIRRSPVPAANVRAVHILAAIELARAGVSDDLPAVVGAWCDELVACRRDGVLFDDPDQQRPHLWGHVQEGVLAEAGAFLGRPDLIDVARESALRYLAPLIDGRFDLPLVQPYGVASAVFGVDRLAAVTGDPRFRQLAELARAWFHERNTAERAVYDRAAGKVHDGIDSGVINLNSGAESNIVAAHALLPELGVSAKTHRPAIERLLARTTEPYRPAPLTRTASAASPPRA